MNDPRINAIKWHLSLADNLFFKKEMPNLAPLDRLITELEAMKERSVEWFYAMELLAADMKLLSRLNNEQVHKDALESTVDPHTGKG